MAKQSFTKLNLKVNSNATTIYFNEYPIEVKQYLPISKKMEMIENIVKESVELNQNYYNPGLVEIKQIFAIKFVHSA